MAIERTKCIYCKGIVTEKKDIENGYHQKCNEDFNTFNTNKINNLSINIDYFKDLEQKLRHPYYGGPSFFVCDEHSVNRTKKFYGVVKDKKFIELGMKDLDLRGKLDELGNYTDTEILDFSGSDFDKSFISIEKLSKLKKLNLSNCWINKDISIHLPPSLIELFISNSYILPLLDGAFTNQGMKLIDISYNYKPLTDEILELLPRCEVLNLKNSIITFENLNNLRKFTKVLLFDNVVLYPNEATDLKTYTIDYYGINLSLKDSLVIEKIIYKICKDRHESDYIGTRASMLKNNNINNTKMTLDFSELYYPIIPDEIFQIDFINELSLNYTWEITDEILELLHQCQVLNLKNSLLTIENLNNLRKFTKILLFENAVLYPNEVQDLKTYALDYYGINLSLKDCLVIERIIYKICKNWEEGPDYIETRTSILKKNNSNNTKMALDFSKVENAIIPNEIFQLDFINELNLNNIYYNGCEFNQEIEFPENYTIKSLYYRDDYINTEYIFMDFEFPKWIFNLINLEILDISAKGYKNISSEIFNLKKLKKLVNEPYFTVELKKDEKFTEKTKVKYMNEELPLLDAFNLIWFLEKQNPNVSCKVKDGAIELNLSKSAFEYFPEKVFNLKKLKVLNVSNIYLENSRGTGEDRFVYQTIGNFILDVNLPENYEDYTELEEIDFSGNEYIEKFTDWIYALKRLKIIHLSILNFIKLPFTISKMPALEEVRFKNSIKIKKVKGEDLGDLKEEYLTKFPGGKFVDFNESEIFIRVLNNSINFLEIHKHVVTDENYREEVLKKVLRDSNIQVSNNKIIEFTLKGVELYDLPEEILELKHLKKLILHEVKLNVEKIDQRNCHEIVPRDYIYNLGFPSEVVYDLEIDDVRLLYGEAPKEYFILISSNSTKERILSSRTGRPFDMRLFPVLNKLFNKEELQIEIIKNFGDNDPLPF